LGIACLDGHKMLLQDGRGRTMSAGSSIAKRRLLYGGNRLVLRSEQAVTAGQQRGDDKHQRRQHVGRLRPGPFEPLHVASSELFMLLVAAYRMESRQWIARPPKPSCNRAVTVAS